MYPEDIIKALETELTDLGLTALKTEQAVVDYLSNTRGTALLFMNSLCGCAGTGAREGLKLALERASQKPDRMATVFAQVDEAAGQAVQNYIKPYPFSAPSVALFKDGALVHFRERHQLKGYEAEVIASELRAAFELHGASA